MPFYAIDKKELFSEIEANKRKVIFIFLITLFIFVLTILTAYWLIFSNLEQAGGVAGLLAIGLTIGVFISLSVIVVTWVNPLNTFNSLLNNVDIKKLTTPNTPEEKMLSDIVDEIVIAGLVEKRPEVYIIETDEPNAFAVSKGNDSIIGVTRGIIKLMNRAELSAVIAHELSHILNKDSEVKLLAFLFTSGLLIMFRSVWSSMRVFSSVSRGSRKGGGSALVVVAGIILLLIASYIISLILSYIMSRKQENNADLGALRLTRDKEALINALRKLENYEKSEQAKKLKAQTSSFEMAQKALEEQESGIQKEPYNEIMPSYMFFWKPPKLSMMFTMNEIFSTHPPLNERIKYIESVF
ncbi:MAG: M48 family metalloprotease [Candidatus Anstonellales archaeon]